VGIKVGIKVGWDDVDVPRSANEGSKDHFCRRNKDVETKVGSTEVIAASKLAHQAGHSHSSPRGERTEVRGGATPRYPSLGRIGRYHREKEKREKRTHTCDKHLVLLLTPNDTACRHGEGGGSGNGGNGKSREE
jgi:hypothetical protein